jgi:hypothetical protein
MIAWIDTLIQGVLLGGLFALSGLGLSLSFESFACRCCRYAADVCVRIRAAKNDFE